jgi:23S rRNA pseudouridine1911/1915/1917 synthase
MKKIDRQVSIIYEDDNFLGINKPAGMIVHDDGRSDKNTLADWIVKNYPAIQNVGDPLKLPNGQQIARSGLVHRLDKETSGVLVIAKNNSAYRHLKKLFKEKKIKKIYLAFVAGEVKRDDGIISKPIGRDPKDFRRKSVGRDAVGKKREALTAFRTLKRNGGFSLLEFLPKTGRTHQIRIHAKTIGHPILCDSLYGTKLTRGLGFNRLALHARKIIFKDQTGKEISITAEYPSDFRAALKTFGADKLTD